MPRLETSRPGTAPRPGSWRWPPASTATATRRARTGSRRSPALVVDQEPRRRRTSPAELRRVAARPRRGTGRPHRPPRLDAAVVLHVARAALERQADGQTETRAGAGAGGHTWAGRVRRRRFRGRA